MLEKNTFLHIKCFSWFLRHGSKTAVIHKIDCSVHTSICRFLCRVFNSISRDTNCPNATSAFSLDRSSTCTYFSQNKNFCRAPILSSPLLILMSSSINIHEAVRFNPTFDAAANQRPKKYSIHFSTLIVDKIMGLPEIVSCIFKVHDCCGTNSSGILIWYYTVIRRRFSYRAFGARDCSNNFIRLPGSK